MDVRDFIAVNAADFSRALRDRLSIPEYVDLSRLPGRAESIAGWRERLAGAREGAS